MRPSPFILAWLLPNFAPHAGASSLRHRVPAERIVPWKAPASIPPKRTHMPFAPPPSPISFFTNSPPITTTRHRPLVRPILAATPKPSSPTLVIGHPCHWIGRRLDGATPVSCRTVTNNIVRLWHNSTSILTSAGPNKARAAWNLKRCSIRHGRGTKVNMNNSKRMFGPVGNGQAG